MTRHWKAIAPVALLTMHLCGCAQLQQAVATTAAIIEEHPGLIEEDDRQKWLASARAVRSLVDEIDTAEEIAIGQSMALRTFASLGRPHPDSELQRYVAMVGKVVALQGDRPSLPYSFVVIRNEQTNALALPGGYIFVFTGLLRQLQSEGELAAVLGHEIAHVAERHGVTVMMRDTRIASLVDAAAAFDEDVGEYKRFIDLGFQKLTTEGYDRNYEWKADLAGTRYAWRAGYDPEGLLPFLRRSQRSGTPTAFEFFKTHPDPGVRIRKVEEYLRTLGDYADTPRLRERYRRNVLDRLR